MHISAQFDPGAPNPCLDAAKEKRRPVTGRPVFSLCQNSRRNFADMAEITGPMKKHTNTVTTPTVPPIR